MGAQKDIASREFSGMIEIQRPTSREPSSQWPFQEPKLEVPTIYKALRPKIQGISPQNMALYGAVPPFWDPEIPIEYLI